MDKRLLLNIVVVIHMALTGLMLFHLFKLKSIQLGKLILTFVALLIPILGPSALILYYQRQPKQQKK